MFLISGNRSRGVKIGFGSFMAWKRVAHLRLFPTSSVALDGAAKDPAALPSLLSPLDPKKKAGARNAATPIGACASATIFSSTIEISSSEEALTLPAERDKITVQMSPQAVKTGISA